MNVALHSIKAGIINARSAKAQDVEHARRALAIAEAEFHQLTILLDDLVLEQEREEKKRHERKEVRTDGQRADDFDALKFALRDINEWAKLRMHPVPEGVKCTCERCADLAPVVKMSETEKDHGL